MVEGRRDVNTITTSSRRCVSTGNNIFSALEILKIAPIRFLGTSKLSSLKRFIN